MALNGWMAGAAGVMALTAGVHVFMGGPEINAPVMASGLDPVVRGVSAVVWHGVTVILVVFAVALGWVAVHRNTALELVLIAVQLGFAALFLGYGVGLLGSVWPMPQWTVFLAIPAVMLWARVGGRVV